jgi:monofunctional biosynthetic peptidoglycan transglycosylase
MIRLLKRLCLLVVALLLLLQCWIFSSLWWWRSHPVQTTMFMRSYYYQHSHPHLRHQWRDSEQISDHFKRAVLAGEDSRFLSHHGFDWQGMLFASQRNLQQGQIVAGGSTISQQLAKNLFLFNQRSYWRKAQEAIATIMMEAMWSKSRILEVYCNSVELGDGIYGVEAASRYYFHTSAQHLSQQQAIKLAALLSNPKYFQQHPQDSKYLARQRFIQKYIQSRQLPTAQS